MTNPNTPILVGVGQFTEHLDSPDYQELSPQELGARAARAALADTGNAAACLAAIDAIAAVRTVADSVPEAMRKFVAPFGGSNNLPRSVAKRLGCNPEHALYSAACGDEPQKLVGQYSEQILAGTCRMALVFGAEAIATQRKAQGEGRTLDWNEDVAGSLEDCGGGTASLRTPDMVRHSFLQPIEVYPVFEHARRKRLGMSREDYAQLMGELFADFSAVAAANPYAMSRQAMTAEEIAMVTDRNRMIADPYTKSMVARDWVNQGAAVVVTSVGTARELGIAEDRWVYLHGYADVAERGVLERQDLGESPAMKLAYQAAMDAAGVTAEDIHHFDIYSCFPIAVFNAIEQLGISHTDPRHLTSTGGLPFFGGPGNNYSMHGLAAVVEKLRATPGSIGLVGTNGGHLSKHSVGIYSTTPVAQWRSCDSRPLQAQIDSLPAPALASAPNGWAGVESYTLIYGKDSPKTAVVIGRLEATGERFVANNIEGDQQTLTRMVASDPIDARIYVRATAEGNRFAFSQEALASLSA